ncbi:MAG: helix-turn-helix transcriptional regulator [Myxococcales bacterium]|nr:helix-turn-helix transcriptional regulator [Myxococcales bacterium]
MSKAQAETYLLTEERHVRAKEHLGLLARRIRMMRERKGITQEDFASRCGISVSFVSLLERGERSPSYETLVEVASALDISLSDLFRESPIEAYDDPYYVRLMDFARKFRISRRQVDQLIAVGRAMFALAPELSAAPPRRTDAHACSQQGCERPVLAKGLCASHYHRARRARQ